MSGPYRLGVDVGGTHTDLVLLNVADGSIDIEKVSSTPNNPALGVLQGIKNFVSLGKHPDSIEFFSHGTTITTNALLQMRGAKVGMLITKGYRAIQEIQQQARDGNPFDYFFQRPPQLAPQSATFEASGRIDYRGKELEPLDEESVRNATRAFKEKGIRSIAIVYLFSYTNPTHEHRSRDIILNEWPDAYISLSSEVLPRLREWPRMSTTLLNAYLAPVLVDYIRHLETGLDEGGIKTQQRFLMQSNGGVMPFKAAITGAKTVHTLFSGPAAGAQAAAHLAVEDAKEGLVTLDMGGTSCDIAFIEGGTPLEVTESEVARRRLDVPALDLTTISAGGGSIAWVDGGGLLSVGPQSAGAEPGPVCYGKGGQNPTVTDADIACGFINPDYFLGGTQSLDKDASFQALKKTFGKQLGLTPIEAAVGIRRIVDMRMADEVRIFGAKRGIDPQTFTLLPFGGAGAVHATAVADEMAMNRILIPLQPGAFSALGLLCTDVIHDYIRSELRPLREISPKQAERIFKELESRGTKELKREGLDLGSAIFYRELDMRYSGQGYEIRVPLERSRASTVFDDKALIDARQRFDALHSRIHGHAAKEKPVEVVSYRLRARVKVPKYKPVTNNKKQGKLDGKLIFKETRNVWFTAEKATETPVLSRRNLSFGSTVEGPCIIEQIDSTVVLADGWKADVDPSLNIILTRD